MQTVPFFKVAEVVFQKCICIVAAVWNIKQLQLFYVNATRQWYVPFYERVSSAREGQTGSIMITMAKPARLFFCQYRPF